MVMYSYIGRVIFEMTFQRDLLTLIPTISDLETIDKKRYGEVIKVLKFIFQVDDERSLTLIPSIEEVIITQELLVYLIYMTYFIDLEARYF